MKYNTGNLVKVFNIESSFSVYKTEHIYPSTRYIDQSLDSNNMSSFHIFRPLNDSINSNNVL